MSPLPQSSPSSTTAPSSLTPGEGGRSIAGIRLGGPGVAAMVGRFAVVGGFIVMIAIFSALEPSTFLAASNLKNILDQSAVPVILVCGLTFVLVVGEFDLSYTATLGLCAGIVIKLLVDSGFGVWPAILVTIVAAVVIGLIVGLLVTLGRASSFIVTLAIGSAVTGLEQALTNNVTIYNGIPASFGNLASDKFLGFHDPVWLALVILILAVVLLHGTRYGRHAKAVGGNETAAYLAGVRVRRVKVIAFVLTAALAGVGAVILTSRASSYFPNASAGFLLNTYAAAFLGAAVGARSGFTVAGSAFGVLWITTLQTGLTLHNSPAWTSNFIEGIVLATAVLIAARTRRTS